MADMSKATLEDGKATTTEIERASSRSGEDLGIDEKEIKRTRHRIDWRLIPALGGMYGMALMDRNNLPNAAIGKLRQLKPRIVNTLTHSSRHVSRPRPLTRREL